MTIEERNKLVEDNYQLLLYFYAAYRAKYRKLDRDDVRSMVEDGFLKAADTFDSGKGTFSNWANIHIRKEFYIRNVNAGRIKNSKYTTVSYEEECKPTSDRSENWSKDGATEIIDENAQSLVEKCVGDDFVRWCLEGLTDVQREAVVRVCLNGEDLTAVGKPRGITRQGVYCAKEQGLKNIRRKLADEREFQECIKRYVQNPQRKGC